MNLGLFRYRNTSLKIALFCLEGKSANSLINRKAGNLSSEERLRGEGDGKCLSKLELAFWGDGCRDAAAPGCTGWFPLNISGEGSQGGV